MAFATRLQAAITTAHLRNTESAIVTIAQEITGFAPKYEDYTTLDFTPYWGTTEPGFFLGIYSTDRGTDYPIRINETELRLDEYYKTAGVPFLISGYIGSDVDSNFIDNEPTPTDSYLNTLTNYIIGDTIGAATIQTMAITDEINFYIEEYITSIYDISLFSIFDLPIEDYLVPINEDMIPTIDILIDSIPSIIDVAYYLNIKLPIEIGFSGIDTVTTQFTTPLKIGAGTVGNGTIGTILHQYLNDDYT